MKVQRFAAVFCLSTIVWTTAGCTVMEEEATPRVSQKNVASPEQVNTSLKKATTDSKNQQAIELEKQTERVTLGQTKTYDLSSLLSKHRLSIDPQYFYQNQIFYFDLQENKSTIYTYDTKRQHNKIVHATKHAIPMMTGTGAFLLWVETEEPTKTGVKWSIRQLNITTNQMTTLDTGESRFDTSPPRIDVTSTRASWITQGATAQKTVSTLKSYSLKTGKITPLHSFILKTGKVRDGLFTYEHRDSDDGVTLYTSHFNNGKNVRVLETLDGAYKKEISGLIDFSRSGTYFAFGTEGDAMFQPIGLDERTLNYSASSAQTTIGGIQFLSNTQVVFREGIHQLMYADLKAKTVAPLTDFEELVSPPLLQDGKLTYSITNDKKSTLHVVKLLLSN
ncbi:hypothetical protein ITJ88_07515 [Exiguobacterium sp. TBG-PICH-001]|uniref:hypothetical protein n=1 Tax=Exiguobacterium abrahamii TaxID=2785532 RepID=UPI0018A7CC72|nr:hypothetical protein [Exiguobacterium sp. TBG-PICH-001]MBF8153133.1 hypothetical protein [Exiguobacterium sp. TBG-PICH-001]